jgi:tRNA threonylcarbamoyladenosine biosynthesis protein TsaE
MPELIECRNEEMLPVVARQVLGFAPSERIFLFEGELGAGKTTLIKAICQQLDVSDQVNSPTFSIVNEYRSSKGPVYHFDLYRLKDLAEALDIGIEDYLYSGYYCFVEWPDKLTELLPPDYVKIRIETDMAERHSRLIALERITGKPGRN